MEAAKSSETLVTYRKTTRRHNAEDFDLNSIHLLVSSTFTNKIGNTLHTLRTLQL